MMKVKKQSKDKVLIKKCHVCGQLTESYQEIDRCPKCNKSFLPLNYFTKIHQVGNQEEFKELFETTENLREEDLIRGIYVLW